MSENYTITESGSYFANFRHANGKIYNGELTGCGEAFEVRDEDGEIVTTIPTDHIGKLQDQDIRLAANAISTIEANKDRTAQSFESEKATVQSEDEAQTESHRIDPAAIEALRYSMKAMLSNMYGNMYGNIGSGPSIHIGELHLHLHINA